MKKIAHLLLILLFLISTISYGPVYQTTFAAGQRGSIDIFNKESMIDTRESEKPDPFETGNGHDYNENIALNKEVEASSSYGDWTAEKAVDGIVTRDSRWQSGEDVEEFEPVYLVLDLGHASEISNINIQFDMKMYGNFKVETSATNEEDSWKEVTSVDDVPEGDDLHIEYTKDFTEGNKEPLRVERYVRLYFTNGNPSAVNQSIGIQELELYGSHMKEIIGNIALNKGVKASDEYGNYLAHYATDGIDNEDQERWQSGEDVSQFKPVWLEIDLQETSKITGVNIKFARKMYGNFEIQTSATNDEDADWEILQKISDIEPSDESDPSTKEWTFDEESTERYVRLYFTDVNSQAANKSIGIFELELIGEQVVPNRPTSPSNAKQALDEVEELRVDEKGTQIVFPKVDENYELSLKGSDLENIISNDGMITNYNFYDYDVDVLVQVVNKNDEADRAEKNLVVHIPSKKDLYPELFPKVDQPNKEPIIIPSLQEWSGYEGDFELSDQTRIIVDDKDNLGLNKVAENLRDDVQEFTGINLEISTGTASANDIELVSLANDKYDVGEEGYILLNNDNGLKIYSHTYTGVLYGTITLEQVFYQQQHQESYSFPKGIIRDYPQFGIRGVMVDVGRIPYRMNMLTDLSKAFSFYKINELHVHLNDNIDATVVNNQPNNDWEKAQERFGAFRIESDTFPSLGPDKRKNDFFDDVQYTKEEYLDFQKDAKEKGINIVSEIDTPGHALVFNKYVENNREEAKKAGITGDIRNVNDAELLALSGDNYENAALFIRLLFDEYLGIKDDSYHEENAVFIGDTVHIGADEYWDIQHNVTNPERDEQRENYGKYVLDMHEKVTKAGKTTRVWGHIGSYLDGLPSVDTTKLNDVVIDAWFTGHENIQKRIDEGYKLVNVDEGFLYGNPGRDRRDIVNVEYLYENWTPHIMNHGYKFKKGEPALLGAKTALWSDINQMGVTERDSFERLIRGASVVAEKTWGGTDEDTTFDEFSFAFSKLYGGPGIEIASDIEANENMILDYNFENVLDDKVFDFTGNNHHGVITGGKVVNENKESWMAFDGKTAITTSIDSLDYPYTVQFDIKLSDEDMVKNEQAILFDGYDGRLSIDKHGKLFINRSFFTQDFGYTVPANQIVNITLVGTQQVTKLYVDGKLEQTLIRRKGEDTDFDYLMSTFVFPLQKIGEGFNGQLANVNVYNQAMNPQLVLDSFNGVEQSKVNVSQNKGVTGHAQNPGEGGWDDADRKLHVAWKAIDGDGNTLDGGHSATESDKDSFFHGRLNDSHIGLDFYKKHEVSEVVLQFDQKPSGGYKLQQSDDGINWTDIGSYTEDKVTFDKPIYTQYLRMVGSQFKLREIEVYENVDKSELKQTIDESKKLVDNLGLSFTDTKGNKELFNAYQSARSVYHNAMADQSGIDHINEELLAHLKDTPEEVDKTALRSAVTEAEAKDESAYTAKSWKAFAESLVDAQKVLADDEATESDVAGALKNLQDAIKQLEKVSEETEVDKSSLKSVVAEAEEKDEAAYTAKSWKVFSEALADAQKVLTDEDATESDVAEALESLQDAIKQLEKVSEETEVDKSSLKSAVAEAEEKEEAAYTAKSWKVFSEALANAQKSLADDEATESDVADALESLQKAVKQLEKYEEEQENQKEPEVKEDKTNEEKDVEIKEDEKPGTVEIEEETTKDDEGKDLPKTATNTFNVLLIGGLLLLIGSMAFFVRRRQS